MNPALKIIFPVNIVWVRPEGFHRQCCIQDVPSSVTGRAYLPSLFCCVCGRRQQAVGIGAGNRRDFGILGRIEQRQEGCNGGLQYVDQSMFETIDEGRTQNPE